MIQFLPIILKNYKLIAGIAVIAAAAFGGYKYSNTKWEAKYSELEVVAAKLREENAKLETESQKITIKEVVKYVDKIRYIKQKAEVITKEIPVYVTKEADANCTITDGFVMLHNKAANSRETKVSDATFNPNATTSGTKLSTVAETVTVNYSKYHELSQQLISLQNWVKEQEKLWNNNKE